MKLNSTGIIFNLFFHKLKYRK